MRSYFASEKFLFYLLLLGPVTALQSINIATIVQTNFSCIFSRNFRCNKLSPWAILVQLQKLMKREMAMEYGPMSAAFVNCISNHLSVWGCL